MKKLKKTNQVQNSISYQNPSVQVLVLIFDFSPSPSKHCRQCTRILPPSLMVFLLSTCPISQTLTRHLEEIEAKIIFSQFRLGFSSLDLGGNDGSSVPDPKQKSNVYFSKPSLKRSLKHLLVNRQWHFGDFAHHISRRVTLKKAAATLCANQSMSM